MDFDGILVKCVLFSFKTESVYVSLYFSENRMSGKNLELELWAEICPKYVQNWILYILGTEVKKYVFL